MRQTLELFTEFGLYISQAGNLFADQPSKFKSKVLLKVIGGHRITQRRVDCWNLRRT